MGDGDHIIKGLRDAAMQRREAAHVAIEQAKREIERIDIEIGAYEKALAALKKGEGSAPRHLPGVLPHHFPRVALELTGTAHGTSSAMAIGAGPSFTDKWVAVFRDLYDNAAQPYSYDDVLQAAMRQGSTSNSGSLRAQMMKAVNLGLFDRAEAGKFNITDAGLDLIGISRKENGAP
jgi:hypothetical protein